MITFANLGKLGRFGNQLFQIAATIGHAKRMNTNYCIPKWEYSKYFKNPPQEGISNNIKQWREPSNFVNYIDIDRQDDIDLFGYFQSHKFFEGYEDEIKKLFVPHETIVEKLYEFYPDFKNQKTASLHVRRTDYLEKSDVHVNQPLAYYVEAMEQLKDDVDVFYVFSDDINWCKMALPTHYKYEFVERRHEILDFILMSMCNHNIICNSSFSWWAAFLNNNPNKKVFMPDKWFGKDYTNFKVDDKNPENWIVLKESPKLNVGLMVIATGKYTQYVNDLVTTANKYFFHTHNLKIYLFTDDLNLNTPSNVVKIYQEHLGFPGASLKRYEMFDKASDILKESDYLFYCDVDMRFVDYISEDSLPNESGLVGTQHPGFIDGKRGTYDINPNSLAFVSENEGVDYFAGGFNGGTSEQFLKMSKEIKEWIDSDLSNDYIALWHDESYMNRYFINHVPKKLTPSYCYPERYWTPIPYPPKLLALYKEHYKMRVN